MDDAETEDKEASEELRRAEWAVAQRARTDDSGAVASSTSQVPVRDVHSRSARMGDETFLEGSVAYMASQLRHEFKTDLGTAVYETAAQLLTHTLSGTGPPVGATGVVRDGPQLVEGATRHSCRRRHIVRRQG